MRAGLTGAGCDRGARCGHGMARGVPGGPERDLDIFGKMKAGGVARLGWGDVSILGKVKGGAWVARLVGWTCGS